MISTRSALAATLAFTALGLAPSPAAAQEFAEPPEGEKTVAVADGRLDDSRYDDGRRFIDDDVFFHPKSTVRFGVGPTLRLGNETADGGLFAAVDIGEGPAGVRFSGAWVQVGSDAGLSQYMGELWLDFGHDKRLHPIVGAGAGAARVESSNAAGTGTQSDTVGLGLLRGGVQYLLPVDGADARASLEVIGTLPAIRGEDGPDLDPWVLLVASVGVGF